MRSVRSSRSWPGARPTARPARPDRSRPAVRRSRGPRVVRAAVGPTLEERVGLVGRSFILGRAGPGSSAPRCRRRWRSAAGWSNVRPTRDVRAPGRPRHGVADVGGVPRVGRTFVHPGTCGSRVVRATVSPTLEECVGMVGRSFNLGRAGPGSSAPRCRRRWRSAAGWSNVRSTRDVRAPGRPRHGVADGRGVRRVDRTFVQPQDVSRPGGVGGQAEDSGDGAARDTCGPRRRAGTLRGGAESGAAGAGPRRTLRR